MDYGFELFRKAMLTSLENDFDDGLIKRAFLFKEVFDLLKKDPIIPIIWVMLFNFKFFTNDIWFERRDIDSIEFRKKWLDKFIE